MSLVFAAVTPHPPLLLPSIGKEKTKLLDKTAHALRELEQELYVTHPEVLVILSPHTGMFKESFSVNAHDGFESNLAAFGDLLTKKSWAGAPELAALIAHEALRHKIPVQLISKTSIDHGTSIPLFFLTEHLSTIPVLPVGFSDMSVREHVQFGEMLEECFLHSNKRIAVIASGDLAHVKSQSSSDIHPFDEQLINLLETKNTTGIMNLDATLRAGSDECAYRSLLILLGIIKNQSYTFKTHCYEAPFGVGYLTGQFVL